MIPAIFARAKGLMGQKQCHVFSQGGKRAIILPVQEIAIDFVFFYTTENEELFTFTDNGIFLVEVIIVANMDAE